MNIAVIPARGGSKRIPRKNIKLFRGKPIIAWSIAAAIQSNCFDRIIVSTDDDEIAAVAQEWGAEAPFRRPAHLSDEHATITPVMAHAITWQEKTAQVEKACCILATSPMLRAIDLIHGNEALSDPDVAYAFPVAQFGYPIQRALRVDRYNRVQMFYPEHLETRSQDLEDAWHDAGQFYWGRPEAWLAGLPIFGPKSVAIPFPRTRVQDIDTPDDWMNAEFAFDVLANAERSNGMTF